MELQDNVSIVFNDVKTEHFFDLVIKKCIEKLGALLDEYPNEKYSQQFSDLKKRYNNSELKLAVIGEFNTGKSTFINAILKKDYLSTDNVPTTVIPTYIRWDGGHNSPPVIKIRLAGDDNEYVIKKNRVLLEKKLGITLNQSDDLERITTNNDLIGIVSHVTVSFPAEKRYTDFCLIDTPGANPGAEETKEHANITREVLREEADATLILFPANTTGNRSALEFISQNASHLLGGAAFVITKTDMIDSEKEMEKIVKYLKGLVKQRYGLDNQTIYTCSAKKAIRANGAADYSNPFLLQFNNMIEDILKSLSQKRKQIIFKKVSALLNTILNDLRKEQKTLSQKLQDDMKALEKYSLENLEKEYKLLYSQFESDLNSIYQSRTSKVSTNISSKRGFVIDGVEYDLNRISSLGDLRSYAKDGIRTRLSSFENSINDGIKADVGEQDSIYSTFSEKVFSRLNEYQLQISSPITKGTIGISIDSYPDVAMEDIIGRLGIGALILLFINPVALAAVLAVGWLFSDALLRRMKNSIEEKVEAGLREASSAIEDKWKKALDDTKSKYLSSGRNLMKDYKSRYAKIFQDRTAADNQERQRIQSELSRVNESLREIDIMESVLAIPVKLNSYIGVDQKTLEKAMCGDIQTANLIAVTYQQLYSSTKSEEYHSSYLQWSAFSLLFGEE